MMTTLSDLLKAAEVYVFDLLKDKLPNELVYHNFNHTKDTVDACEEMANHYQLNDIEKEDLMLAAWFHDTGYTVKYKDHEEESVKIAETFLRSKLDEKRLSSITEMIKSTHVNVPMNNLKEEILHDADCINMGKKQFCKNAELLRVEWEQSLKQNYTDLQWAEGQLHFLINKKFKTAYASQTYGDGKEKNLKKQRKQIEKLKNDQFKLHLKEKGIEVKSKKEGRGIETLYRSVYDYHINLSSIADNKANIMISINTIIVSLIITLFGSGYTFTGDGTFASVRFIFPMAFLVISSLLSVVFAILSARPNITSKEKFELDNKNSSILFFGNFAQIQINEFVSHIKELKKEKEELYDSMTVDIYHLGVVLVRKYKLLTTSYNIFMGGLVVCAVGFLLIMLLSY